MSRNKLHLLLSMAILFGQNCIAQTTSSSGSPPKSKVEIQLIDPSLDDWRQIQDHEAIKILNIIDAPDDGKVTVDDQAIKNLDQFRNLRTLVIGADELTDDAIPQLLKLKRLEGLAIYNCKFTDEGIQKLEALPEIQTIGFMDTKVTQHGISQLQNKIPKAYIELGRFNRSGKVFDANGCLTSYFYKKHLKP